MNKTFIIASIHESWQGSIQLAEQLILQAKLAGVSSILLDTAHDAMTRETFTHLKKYSDNFNLAVVARVHNKDALDWIQQEQIKIHVISEEIIQKPVLCATLIQTGIPALVPVQDENVLILGDDFKNVKYLKEIKNKDDMPIEFKENLVGIVDNTDFELNAENAVKLGAKIIVKKMCLDKLNHPSRFADFDEFLSLRKKLNRVEFNF